MAVQSCTAFEGYRRIASGEVSYVATKAKVVFDRAGRSPVLIFDDQTSELVEIDLRGTRKEVVERLKTSRLCADPKMDDVPRGPGRPKLGVVAREVTLLPRHWQWL